MALITSQKKSGHRNYRSWNGWPLRCNKHNHPSIVITNIGLDTQFSETQLKLSLEKGRYYKTQYSFSYWRIHPETKAVLQLKPQKKAQQYICSELISENHPSDLTGITKFTIRNCFTNY
jgi:hypothetical protein